jgi:hypothetical protein
MTAIEYVLLAGLVAWSAASLCYVCRVPGIDPWLKRWNLVSAYARWSMFNARRAPPAAPEPRLVVEFRDAADPAGPGAWEAIPLDFTCGWRGFFWMPRRRLALRLRHLAADARAAADLGPAAAGDLRRILVMLGSCVRATHPGRTRGRREIRIVECPGDDTRAPGARVVAHLADEP